MKKINLEKINKKLLTKYIRYVEPMSEYKSLAQIHCFDINKSKSGEPNYEKFFINKHNEIVAHFESKHEFIAELLHEKNERLFVLDRLKFNEEGEYPLQLVRIEENGKNIVLNSYENIEYGMEDGCFAVKKDGLWGFIDKDGNEIIPPMYENYNSFHNGYACVKKDGMWGVIDKQNNLILPFNYYKCRNFYNGIAVVVNKNWSNEVINQKGEVLHTAFRFNKIFNLGNGSVVLEDRTKGTFEIVEVNK